MGAFDSFPKITVVGTKMQTEFAMSGKATSFIGPMLFGWLTILFETQRAGMSVAIAFWLIGLILLAFVKPSMKTNI